jgi:acetyl esterase/lipase
VIQKLRSPHPAALLAMVTLLGTALASHAGATPPPHANNPKKAKVQCVDRDDNARDLSVRVATTQGFETAQGRYAVPTQAPTELVVFAHGYGHTSASWVEHMKRSAAEHGVATVAMDYRGTKISPDANGDGLPEARGWRVMEGAQDSIAAAQLFEAQCPSIEKIVIFGVSMGGNASGLAVALAKDAHRKDGSPVFDYWVDVEGAVNVIETYAGASALESVNEFAANAKADIEEEMGGTFQEKPDVYAEHAVVTRIEDIQASGIEGVIVVHGLDDGLVPYNQAREMTSLLAAAEIPTDMYTIGRKSAESERETTATSYAGNQLDPEYNSPMAGHASEKSQTHIVMVTAFDRLWTLLDGEAPGPYREFFVDGPTGTYPEL